MRSEARAGALPSVTSSVLLWLLAPLCLIVLAFLAEAWASSRLAIDRLYDQMLIASAISIREAVDRTYGDAVEDEIVSLLRNTTGERIYYRIVGPGRSYLTGYDDFRPPGDGAGLEGGVPRFSDMTFRGYALRAVSLRFFSSDALVAGWITVHVGLTRNERDAATLAAVAASGLRLGVLLVTVGTLAFLAVRRGLRPVLKFRDQIETRSALDLSLVDAPLPSDLRPIGDALNMLVRRLHDALENEREFIANASHQLRSPLTALQLRAQLLLRDTPKGALRDQLAALVDDTRASARLAEQLLTFSRTEAGLLAEEADAFDLAALVRGMAPEALALSERRGCDLGFHLPDGAAAIVGSELLCREIVMNLVDNATRHGGAGTVVDIRVRGEAGRVVLLVADDGPGIPPQDRERVFARFQQGPSSRPGGAGLGLAIVRRIAERHRAFVTLTSRPEADLTCFRVEFPAAVS